MTSQHTYKVIELVGSSPQGLQQAIENAIARAGETLRNLDWFEVKEIRGNRSRPVKGCRSVTLAV